MRNMMHESPLRAIVGAGRNLRLLLAMALMVTGVFAVDAASMRLAPDLRLPAMVSFTLACVVWVVRRWRCVVPDHSAALDDLRYLVMLQPVLRGGVLELGGWALEARPLLRILRLAQSSRVLQVVECGSGVSTLLLGRLFKQRGRGRVVAFEESATWREVVSDQIAAEGLSDFASVVHAPLSVTAGMERVVGWYDGEIVRSALERIGRIDLLVVDGPVMTETYSRWPALPFFRPWLADGATVILDDINRAAEAAVLATWRDQFDLRVETDGGTSCGQAYIELIPPKRGVT